MTYRRLTQRQLDARTRKLAAMQRGRDLARMERPAAKTQVDEKARCSASASAGPRWGLT